MKSKTVRGSRADARAVLDGMMTTVSGLSKQSLTVAGLLGEWIESIRSQRAPSTISLYQSLVRNHIPAWLYRIKVSELTSMHLSRWLRELNVGSSTKQKVFKVLKQAIDMARKQKMVSENVATQVDVPRSTQKTIEPFSPAEVKQILKEVSDDYRLYVTLGFYTGMRQGELIGLQWQDLDVEEMSISVRRQVVQIGWQHLPTEDLKTAGSRRSIPICEEILDELLAHRRSAMAYAQAAADCHILARHDGSLPKRTNFAKGHWKTLLKRLGITHRGFHHARHTFATIQLSSGVPIPLVSAMLGHSSVSTTLNVYARWLPADIEKAREVPGRMFG